jgi:uncharacterized protein (TIGR02246 family)
MKTLAIALYGLTFVAWATSRGSPSEGPNESVYELVKTLDQKCWNEHDAKSCGAFWTPDGSFVTPTGTRVDGRTEIEKLLDRDLKGLFKGTTSRINVQGIHWASPDLAFVDMEQVVTGFAKSDGGSFRDQVFNWALTLVRRGSGWLIGDARTYIFIPPSERSGTSTPPSRVDLSLRRVPIPGGNDKPVLMDYLAADRREGRIWIPAGETGAVVVINAADGALSRAVGFPTSEHDLLGSRHRVGPSAVAVANGAAYIGNRGDSTICAVDPASLKRGPCLTLGAAGGGLAGSADGLVFIPETQELWATLGAPPLGIVPPKAEIVVIDAKSPRSLRVKARIRMPGAPEGYAIDERRGLFYTNLEEQDRTIAVWARGHRLVANWPAGCGREGPRGLAVDDRRNLVFVACTNQIVTLDAGHGGVKLSAAEAGLGIDNIDYVPEKQLLYVAAGKSALLTVFHVDDRGRLSPVASAPTAKGARVVVADAQGTAYVADSAGAQILEFRLTPAMP